LREVIERVALETDIPHVGGNYPAEYFPCLVPFAQVTSQEREALDVSVRSHWRVREIHHLEPFVCKGFAAALVCVAHQCHLPAVETGSPERASPDLNVTPGVAREAADRAISFHSWTLPLMFAQNKLENSQPLSCLKKVRPGNGIMARRASPHDLFNDRLQLTAMQSSSENLPKSKAARRPTRGGLPPTTSARRGAGHGPMCRWGRSCTLSRAQASAPGKRQAVRPAASFLPVRKCRALVSGIGKVRSRSR